MPLPRIPLFLASSACALAVASTALADVKLASVFGDHMVLQRRAPLPVWGTADPGEQVTVSLAGQSAEATADDQGHWKVTLEPLEEVGPHELVVEGENRVELSDVLVGEVWLCGGQSNMEWSVAASNNAQQEIASADHPKIRIFNVAHKYSSTPLAEAEGQWQVVSPETIAGFSAIGYFFGRELQQELDVPVGLIGSNWGGTLVQAWLLPEDLAKAGYPEEARRGVETLREIEAAQASREAGQSEQADAAESQVNDKWAAVDLNDSGWNTIELPLQMTIDGIDVDGTIWFRRAVEVPETLAGKPMTLTLGAIDDHDITWFNGQEVGRTGPETPNAWQKPRQYEVPGDLVKAGRNVIAIRVTDTAGGGGFIGEPADLALTPENGEAISLAGPWRAAVERISTPGIDALSRGGSAGRPQDQAGSLYQGMIAPLTPYAVRGFLWYQGESNANRADDYASMLRAMIENWRREFEGPGEAQPFLIVQLANFMPRTEDPATDHDWANLREAQREVALDEGNGLAVTIDIGDAGDIHPRNKQDVGKRLARLALRDVYEKDVVAEGPTVGSARVEDGKVILDFEHAEGLTLRGDATKTFAVGDAEGKFVWAEPTVKGQAIELSYEGIGEPAIVRYAWQNNPPAPLYNAAGLPAGPFEVKIEP